MIHPNTRTRSRVPSVFGIVGETEERSQDVIETVGSLVDIAARVAGKHSRCQDIEKMDPALDELLLKKVCVIPLSLKVNVRNGSLLKEFLYNFSSPEPKMI